MRKTILSVCIGMMTLVGIVLASSPFFLSMKPPEKVKSGRSKHSISAMRDGDFLIEPYGGQAVYGEFDELVLVIKDWDGAIYPYLLPASGGNVVMPNGYGWWGWGDYICSNFGPETDADNKIRKSGVIKCHDIDHSEWGMPYWVWSYSGQAHHSWMSDMGSLRHEIKDGYLFINR